MTQNSKETKIILKDLININTQSKLSTKPKRVRFGFMQQHSIKKINPNIVYDDFIYTDKLTKKKIKMSEAKTSYQNKNSSFLSKTSPVNSNYKKKPASSSSSKLNQKLNQKDQIAQELLGLNQCFLMLKSTEMFKLNSLRQKIFGNGEQSLKNSKNLTRKQIIQLKDQNIIQNDYHDIIIKKKKIRQILQQSVKQANREQFHKYFSIKDHKLNHKIILMNKKLPKSFNKNNIQKIIETLKDKSKFNKEQYKLIQKKQQYFTFPGEKKLIYDLIEYMKKQIKINGEYLVIPEKNKLLYRKLYHNISFNKRKRNQLNQSIGRSLNRTSMLKNQLIVSTQKTASTSQNNRIPLNKSDLTTNFSQTENYQNIDKKINYKNLYPNQSKGQHSSKPESFKIKEYSPTRLMKNIQDQSQRKQRRTMVMCSSCPSSSRKRLVMGQFLNQFEFSHCKKRQEIVEVKLRLQRNKRPVEKKNRSKQQRLFLFILENGSLFDVQKQILMNEQYLFIKDDNQNNLLHICAKNRLTQLFLYIIERYKKCENKKNIIEKWGTNLLKNKIQQKNKYNRNVLDLAKLFKAQEIIQNIQKMNDDFRLRFYHS